MDVKLKTPLRKADTTELKLGDTVYLTGTIYTARDSAHKRMVEEGSPIDLEGAVIFHAGPIIQEERGSYQIVAIGPTTSTRMNTYQPEVLDMGVRAVVGKGGMDEETQKALERNGAVFLTAVGGCAALYAKSIVEVKGVNWIDLGVPEAVWELEVKDFGPLFVTMDSHGGNLYEQVRKKYPLKGFIDTHIHTAPDVKPRLLSDVEAADAASREKMDAIVIKSHIEATSGRAAVARKLTGFEVFGGVCLNSSGGGLNVDAVKAAASMGGKVVWLPTISRDEIDLASKENLDKLEDILTVVIENDVALATGHLKVEDIFQVLDLAGSMGLERVLVNHPLTRVVGATIKEQKEMSRKAYLEHCYVACLPGHDGLDPQRIATAIKEVGARRCILATDLGQTHNPSPTIGFKLFIEAMMELGISREEIELMCQSNPRSLFY